jgi:hypothetical protein
MIMTKNEHIMPCFTAIAKDAKHGKGKNWEKAIILTRQVDRESVTGWQQKRVHS